MGYYIEDLVGTSKEQFLIQSGTPLECPPTKNLNP